VERTTGSSRPTRRDATDKVAGMTDTLVAVERRDDGVALVTLQNGKVNSLSTAVLSQLQDIAEDLTVSPR
jgi:enoyl-CoA hydratase/carnithine racemase